MKSFSVMRCLAGLLPVSLLITCTTLEHTNPYDPETTFEVIVREDHGQLVHDQTVPSDCDENNPLIISEWIQLKACLTIQPGVTMRFHEQAGLELSYRGLIRAYGTEDAAIVFASDYPTHMKWRGIEITDNPLDTNVFEYCRFERAMIRISGDVRFENCVFDNCTIDPVNIAGTMFFRGCRLIFTQIDLHDGKTDVVVDSCYLDMSNIQVKNQPFFRMHNSYARSLTAQNTKLELTNNRFIEDIQTAITMLNQCSGSITDNVFDGVTTAIYIRTTGDPDIDLDSKNNSMIITDNNFIDVEEYVVSLKIIGASGESPQTGVVDMSGNYWETTDTSEIRTLIYDAEDDTVFGIGSVEFLPFRTSPVSDAGPNW